MGVFFAILCLIFAACNDLVFKFYARKPRSNGYFAAIIGIIWMAVSFCFVRSFAVNWQATVFWGIVSGSFSIGGNLLMLEAMRSLDAGMCSTIYRLNMVPAVLGAALFLGESISPTAWIGIFCALFAVAGFLPRKKEGGDRKPAFTGFLMMIAASLMRAGMGLSYSYAFSHQADRPWVVVVNSLFWISGGFLYVLRERRILPPPESEEERRDGIRKLWKYGLLSGGLVAALVLTMAASLAFGKASIVLPIAQMSFVLTGILGVIFLKEKMDLRKIFAMLLGAAAILFLSL